MNQLKIIEGSGCLTKGMLNQIKEISKDLQVNFEKKQGFRTRTEMEISVLNDLKFPTSDSKYWQAIREQAVMYSELTRLSFAFKRNVIEMKKLNKAILEEKDDLDRELLEVDLEEKLFNKYQQEKTAKERIREILEWQDIIKREEKLMVTDGTSPDDHQLISYTQRWIKQRIAMGNNGSPSERHNLFGQLQSGLEECKRRGMLGKVTEPFPDDIKENIRKDTQNVKIL